MKKTRLLIYLILFALLFLNPATSHATEKATVDYEMMGLGGGGAIIHVMIDPQNSNNYFAICDMGGLYRSPDRGETWQRAETNGYINTMCFADDGTIFCGCHGLYASTDGGETLQMIYPKEEDVEYYHRRCGWNSVLMFVDGFDNGYLQCVDTYGETVYFVTVDWQGNMRLMSSDFDGENLEILTTASYTISSHMELAYDIIAEKDGLYFSDEKSVWYYDLHAESFSEIYTAEGRINDFAKVGEQYFILDDTAEATKILYTTDFASYQDLMAYNDLENSFRKYDKLYLFDWHFRQIEGNNFENIYLFFKSDVSEGIMKFNGEKFEWVYDTVYFTREDADVEGWSFGSVDPIFEIGIDPNDDNHLLVANAEAACDIYYSSAADREIKSLHTKCHEDGTFSTTGLDVLCTYSVKEDPFDSEHLIICSTDVGIQNSFNGGESWTRMEITGTDYARYNTCYDLYFDTETEGLIYGAWSAVHDVPYKVSTGYRDWPTGGLAISEDGGTTWDFSYSTGIPKDSIPVKMSVVPCGDELMMAVATFNNGFYLSYDSGKTFTSINTDMKEDEGFIWGLDVVIADNQIYCLTGTYLEKEIPSYLYVYDLQTGETTEIDLGDIVLARSLTYDAKQGLFINVVPYYESRWLLDKDTFFWFNYGGGIYKVEDNKVNMFYECEDGIFNSTFASDGTMYAAAVYGEIYRKPADGEFTLYADGLFPELKNVNLSPDERTLYVTTMGGGTYRMAAENAPVEVQEPAGITNVSGADAEKVWRPAKRTKSPRKYDIPAIKADTQN